MPWYVYQVTNVQNGKRYVGKTNDVERRWREHCYAAAHGSHFFFHRAIRKHGPGAFDVQVVETLLDEETALIRERCLIEERNTRDRRFGYNIAEGGTGGNTMSSDQLESQYAIKLSQVEEFRRLFFDGLSRPKIAKHFGVSTNAVTSCADRLQLSFEERKNKIRAQKCLALRQKKQQRRLTRQLTDDYSRRRAEIARRVNRARGTPEHVQQQIKQLYFDGSLTAKQVAIALGITHGAVRSTISRAYAAMTLDERLSRGKNSGRWKEVTK